MSDAPKTEEKKKPLTIERFAPLRCVLRRHREGLFKGAVEGYVEYSFAMGWTPNDVRVLWSGEAWREPLDLVGSARRSPPASRLRTPRSRAVPRAGSSPSR